MSHKLGFLDVLSVMPLYTMDGTLVLVITGETNIHTLFGYAGFILDKKIGVNQPKRIENANILIANTRT